MEHQLVRSTPATLLAAVAPRVELATSGPSALRVAVNAHFPDCPLGFILNPTKYERPVGALVDRRGKLVGIVKYARHGDDVESQRHERYVLAELAKMGDLVGTIPSAVADYSDHLGVGFITNAFQGAPAPLEITPQLTQWLSLLQLEGYTTVAGSRLVRHLTTLAQKLPQASYGPLIRDIHSHALHALAGVHVPVTVVHGDLAPWNIVYHAGHPKVFDWEFACLHGVPGWDEAYHVLQVGIVKRHWARHELVTRAAESLDAISYPYTEQQRRALILLLLTDLVDRNMRFGSRVVAREIASALHSLLAGGFLRSSS